MVKKDWTGNLNSVWKTIGASNHSKYSREADDYYATDPIAIDKLLTVERLNQFVWECACGGGSAVAYAWFVWQKGYAGATEVRWI